MNEMHLVPDSPFRSDSGEPLFPDPGNNRRNRRNPPNRPALACGTALMLFFASLGCGMLEGTFGPREEPATASPALIQSLPAATPESAPTRTSTDIPTAAPEPVTIRWWSYDTGSDQKAQMLIQAEEFSKTHPNVTIQLTTLERDAYKQQIGTALNSDRPPSLFENEGDYAVAAFARAGLLQDISAAVDDGWGSAFLPAALDCFTVDGRQYGVPRDLAVVGIWYNQSQFRQAGIDRPPATWAEFLSDAGKLKAAGITPIAVGEGDKWSGAFWWEYLAVRLGGRAAIDAALSREGAFTDLPFVQAGEELKTLIDLHPFEAGFLEWNTYPDASAWFGDGKASMHLMGQWEKENQKTNSSDGRGLGGDLGWFPFPAVEGGAGSPGDILGGINGWLIAKDAPEETLEFLKTITGADPQCQAAGQGSLPALLSAGDCIQDPYMKTVWQALSRAGFLQVYYDVFLPPGAGGAVNEAVEGLFTGTRSPGEAAQIIDDVFAAGNH
jgi:raffinose/stachyose/melibiose transport system substrate-binding protein